MSRICYNKNMLKKSCVLGLAILGGVAFTGANTYADENDFAVTIGSYIEMTVPGTSSIIMSNVSGSTFGETDIDVVASTNSTLGYTVTLTTEHSYLESNTIDPSTSEKAKILALSSMDNRTEELFRSRTDDNNKWGISIGDKNHYNPVPASATIVNTNTAATDDTTTINVGAKLDTSVIPGTYSITMSFSAVAKVDTTPAGVSGGDASEDSPDYDSEDPDTKGFPGGSLGRSFEVYYADTLRKPMYVLDSSTASGYRAIKKKEVSSSIERFFAIQDMSPAVCNSNVTNNTQVRVLDLRDAKTYWIGKFADGKCWMTQNLDYELQHGTLLRHATSDIGWTNFNASATWNPTNSSGVISGGISGQNYGWIESQTEPSSTDLGEIYVVSSGNTNNDTIYYSLSSCMAAHHTKGECMHYHIGNYYNWTAAIAMNDSTSLNTEFVSAADSVCPAGWRLPKGVTSSTKPVTAENAEEMNVLMNAVGISTGFDGRLADDGAVSFLENGFNMARSNPLYLTRAGRQYNSDGWIDYVGSDGQYWTSTVGYEFGGEHEVGGGYIYELYSSDAPMFIGWSRRYGLPVRCVARDALGQ